MSLTEGSTVPNASDVLIQFVRQSGTTNRYTLTFQTAASIDNDEDLDEVNSYSEDVKLSTPPELDETRATNMTRRN